jgi:transposase-like protein
MTIAPDVKLRIVELRNEGYTYAAITEMTGVIGIYHICKEAGLTGTGHGHLGRKSKHSKEEKQQIVNLRNEGYTYAAITEMTGVVGTYHICKEAGLTGAGKHSKEEKQQIVNLRNEGYTYAAIAKMTGVALHNVARCCKKAGAKSGYGHLGRKRNGSPVAARNKIIRGLRIGGLTLVQIGEIYDISRERVRQLCVGINPPDLRTRSNCCICGVEFVGCVSKYCSGECRKKGQIELCRQKNAKFSKHATVELVCTGCGIKFKRTNRLEGIAECGRISQGRKDSGKRFCSKECYYKKALGRN